MSNSVRITVSECTYMNSISSCHLRIWQLTFHLCQSCPQQGNVSNILHCIVWIQSTPPSVLLTAAMCPEMKRMLINTAASRIYLKISITSNCNHSSFDVRTLSKQRTHEPFKSRQLTENSFHWGASNHVPWQKRKWIMQGNWQTWISSCIKTTYCKWLLFTFIHKTLQGDWHWVAINLEQHLKAVPCGLDLTNSPWSSSYFLLP